MKVQTACDKYYQAVEKELKGCAIGPSVLRKLRSDLQDFLDENPDVTQALLFQYFGDPGEYVKEYTATMDAGEIRRSIDDRRFKRKMLVSLFAAILAVIIGLALWIGILNSRTAVDYYEYYIYKETTPVSSD